MSSRIRLPERVGCWNDKGHYVLHEALYLLFTHLELEPNWKYLNQLKLGLK